MLKWSLWVCLCTTASFSVNFSLAAPYATFKRVIGVLSCVKDFARKNSFSQWSPVEPSGDVLELNNSCAHVSRSMLSNLQHLPKARPSLAFVCPCDLWLILMANSICHTIITLEKKTPYRWKFWLCCSHVTDSLTHLRLKTVNSVE